MNSLRILALGSLLAIASTAAMAFQEQRGGTASETKSTGGQAAPQQMAPSSTPDSGATVAKGISL